jgi:ABC-type branched-subunit amino acid transport system substrate-binding protein
MAELEHVDALVAGAGGADQVALREVARRYPRLAFVGVVHGPREATLRRPAPNLFRFGADEAQGVAGLGDYAYRELGWRRAALVLGNWDAGWDARDAFAAEFCARGGRLAGQLSPDFFDPAGGDVDAVPRDVDGVAVFATAFFGPAGFLKRLAARTGDPARGILLGPGIMGDPAMLRSVGPGLEGVTGSAYDHPARVRAYLRRYSRAFPGLSREVASTELVTGYRDAVEAVVVALERADGDPARLATGLRAARPELLAGRVRTDRNGQAVVAPALVRVTRGSRLEEIGRLPLVDQSLGGLLPATLRPDSDPVECRSGGDDAPREARALGSGGEPAGT